MQLRPPQSIDPNVPAIIPEEQQQNFKAFLDRVLDGVVDAASPGIIQAGDELWLAIATIAVTWAGLQVAFSGSINPWEIVKLIIVLSIPKTMLHYYSQALPHTTSTFPQIVVEQGIWLQNMFVSDIVSGMHTELNYLFTQQGNSILAAWQRIDIENLSPSTAYAVITQAVPSVAFVFFGLLLLALFFITYAQVLWGHLAVSISILLGPIFIPWLVFEPMAFLFWGWVSVGARLFSLRCNRGSHPPHMGRRGTGLRHHIESFTAPGQLCRGRLLVADSSPSLRGWNPGGLQSGRDDFVSDLRSRLHWTRRCLRYRSFGR